MFAKFYMKSAKFYQKKGRRSRAESWDRFFPRYASGSFGPTTAGRMDAYVPSFMAQGASRLTLAKGNRSPAIAEACKQFGGFYLGSAGR